MVQVIRYYSVDLLSYIDSSLFTDIVKKRRGESEEKDPNAAWGYKEGMHQGAFRSAA